jgi:group I intron endonuclease
VKVASALSHPCSLRTAAQEVITDFLSVLPVVVYPNSDLNKKEIVNENKQKSGIYRWTNIITGDTYVGSSVNLARRFKSYFNFNYLSKNKMIISKAILKYGYSNFKLEILEYCDAPNVIEREQYYLDLLNPEYNILKTAGSTLGYKHTEETLAKLKARVLTPEQIALATGNLMKVSNSEEQRMAAALAERKNDSLK